MADRSSPTHRDKFIETACALGADENQAAFRAKPAVIARQEPKDEPKSAPEPKTKPVTRK